MRKIYLLLAMAAASLFPGFASAQFFSTKDGFNPDGTYRVQVELMPYVWLPAVSGSAHLGTSTVDVARGIPSAAQLKDTLTGAFIGAGLVRYGLLSAEIDIQYVSARQSRTLPPDILGRSRSVTESGSLTRVAPGIGLTAASGEIAGIPAMLDMRAGVAWFQWDAKVEANRDLFGGASAGDTFIQPWLGTRASFFPTPRWRVELAGMVQGLGLDGGSWGWGASALASYAITDWVNVTLGYRALDSSRAEGTGQYPLPDRRSLSLLAYGPFIGFGFRF